MNSVDQSARSVSPDELPLWQLRDNLVDLTAALADELAVDGDSDRLTALCHLYQATRDALAARDLRAVR